MQTNHLDIYKQVAKETGKSEQMYKDLGSFVFRETSRMMKEPTSLILKLKGIGSWHLRKKRLEILVEEWGNKRIKTREEFASDVFYNIYLDKYELYLALKDRLKDYERYLELKKEIRLKRNETQSLLEPNKREDEGDKSSQTGS